MVLRTAKQKGISFGYCDLITGQRVYPVPGSQDNAAQIIAAQRASLDEAKMKPAMYPSDGDIQVTCSPPLGQATKIDRDQDRVSFAVLLETTNPSLSLADDAQVCLWHDHAGPHDWAELPLKLDKPHDDILLINKSTPRAWYTAELPGLPNHDDTVSFTVKFRTGPQSEWRWVKDSTGISDGKLHYQAPGQTLQIQQKLNDFFGHLSPDVKVHTERPDTDDTLLYSLTCPIHPASDQDSGYQHHQLGKAHKSSRWFALVRLWDPWIAPRHGKGHNVDLDHEAVLISFLRKDGMSVVCLGVSGIDNVVTTFLNDDHGNVIIKGRNDLTKPGVARVLVAVAKDFEVANAAVWYQARKEMSPYAEQSFQGADVSAKDIKPEWIEEWFDGLTYCTWNGLGQGLTADKIYNALDELAKAKINITNLIIDDNWQDLSDGANQFGRSWRGFEANKDGFPEGLKATTAEIRRRHPTVNHIAVWHALLGYWGGISPHGQIADDYKTNEIEIKPGVAGGKMTVVAAEDVNRFYDDFYRFLVDSGVDSVKTDVQCFLDMVLHAKDRRSMTVPYQDAWEVAHLRHFASRAISCMSQAPQIIFHSQLPKNKPRLLVRNSDDFFPDIAASHPWHIFANAHNSLLTQHLNVLPDWDMFQTSHEWAVFHGAARCVSGGPIYFTDTPGQHNIELISQMTAQTPRNKTIILRPTSIGIATDPYSPYEAQAMLKIGAYNGMAKTGTSILGVFNVYKKTVSEFIPLSTFRGTEEGDYIVGSFFSRLRLSKPMNRNNKKAIVGVELGAGNCDILTAYPLQYFQLEAQNVGVALFGLIDKMTGSAAMTGRDIYVESNGRLRIWIALKALGVLGIYISELPSRSIDDNFMISIYGKPISRDCVRKSPDSDRVLEVDVTKAWEKSGEDAGWNNEVTLEVFMR